MFKRFLGFFLASLMVLNFLGCSGSQRTGSVVATSNDASAMLSADVPLLGLPDSSIHNDAAVTPDGPLFVPNNQNGELIVPLRQDAAAPFNGVLFNGPAIARVSVEFRAQQDRCLIERNHDVGLLSARYDADVSTLRLAMSTQERTANVLLSSRDQDIARLTRLLDVQTTTNSGPHIGEGLIWAGGGLVLGVLVVGSIVIYANSHL